MTKKLTQEEFKQRSIAEHDLDYNYDKVVYINNTTKVEIYCNRHKSYFWQSPNKHMAGQGCPVCRYEKTSKSNTKSQESFIEDGERIHPELYDYSQVDYKDTFSFVKIRCKKHDHVFEQKPCHHLQGSGCPICAKEKIDAHINSLISNTEDFVRKAIDAQPEGYYDYSESVYTKAAEKIKIFCNRHQGFFWQTANSHLAGIGCASCAKTGFSREKNGKLYVLKCGDITKVGITNYSPKTRAKSVSKSYGDKFEVLWEISGNGNFIDDLETNVLRRLRDKYARPTKRFQGHSECFLDVYFEDLLFIIKQESDNLK